MTTFSSSWNGWREAGRGVGAARVGVPGVEHGAADGPLAERREQRVLVDDRAARDIDQDRVGTHARELRGPDQALGRRAQRTGDPDEVGGLEQPVQLVRAAEPVGRRVERARPADDRHDPHAERPGADRDRLADVAVADAADGPAGELRAERGQQARASDQLPALKRALRPARSTVRWSMAASTYSLIPISCSKLLQTGQPAGTASRSTASRPATARWTSLRFGIGGRPLPSSTVTSTSVAAKAAALAGPDQVAFDDLYAVAEAATEQRCPLVGDRTVEQDGHRVGVVVPAWSSGVGLRAFRQKTGARRLGGQTGHGQPGAQVLAIAGFLKGQRGQKALDGHLGQLLENLRTSAAASVERPSWP